MAGNLDLLSRRAGFNAALRHFKYTTGLIQPITAGQNPADLLQAGLADGSIAREQIPPILSAMLVDKFEYSYLSRNSARLFEDCKQISETLSAWTALQIVVVYQHPEIGICVINPCSLESWESALPIKKDELLVVYVQSYGSDLKKETLDQAVRDIHAVLAGEKVKGLKEYSSGTAKKVSAPPAAVAPAAKPSASPSTVSSGPKAEGYRITPKYSVLVTNELFHNGNVESWKRIIASYRSTYEDLDVLVYYDGERINDLNALFKWGKVKHGTPIMISIGGVEIKDVSKLRRYLFEGASPRFEVFLKGSIDQPLELF